MKKVNKDKGTEGYTEIKKKEYKKEYKQTDRNIKELKKF
jgi:hypothetical protein